MYLEFMLEVVDITQFVPKALEIGKGTKKLRKTAIDEKRQCYPLRPSPSIGCVLQVRGNQFILSDFFLRRIPLVNVA